MGRERGKGKRGGRGGGRKLFVANVEELQMREEQVNEAARARLNTEEPILILLKYITPDKVEEVNLTMRMMVAMLVRYSYDDVL